MVQYIVTLGLGRLSNNYKKMYQIGAVSETNAISLARKLYYSEVEKEIGKSDPIWNKVLTIESVTTQYETKTEVASKLNSLFGVSK